MRAAIALGNVIGKGQNILMIAVVPPQSDFHRDAVTLATHHDWRADQWRFRAIEIAHESFQTAFVEKLFDFLFRMTRVGENNTHARIQKGQFAQTMFNGRIVKFDHREGFGRRHESDGRTALGSAAIHGRIAQNFQRRNRIAMMKFDFMVFAITPNAQLQPS